jgi:hypothetical protein
MSPPSSGSNDKPSKKKQPEAGGEQSFRRYIPEDRTLHNHICENLTSYKEYKMDEKQFVWER